jgi:hypothetical protein
MTTELSFKPIKRNLWTDFEELFGPNGACAGCWCMFWKLRGKAYDGQIETRQMHNRLWIWAKHRLVGIFTWGSNRLIAVEPRRPISLAHSRTLKL